MTIAEYETWDGLALAEHIRNGDLSPQEALEAALERVSRHNPRLNAIVAMFEDVARKRAAEALPDGPFRGVPFLLKDLHASFPGVPSTSGSRIFRNRVPDHRSTLVARQEAAGLVPFGKTNTSEFGLLPVTEPELHGVTRNPWNPEVTAGGSSGGSASAVAAGIVPLAHASDGGGSIRIPASCCGLFGLKPSKGRQPLGPDRSESFFGYAVEHAVTRSVRDSAALLDATQGRDWANAECPPPGGDFLAGLDEPLAPLRIALCRAPLMPAELHPDVLSAVDDTAALLEELGHHVEEARPAIDGHEFARGFMLTWAANLAAELEDAKSYLGRPVRQRDVERTTWLLNLVGRSTSAMELALIRRRLQSSCRNLARFFEDYDILLTPTLGRPPVPHGSMGASGSEAAFQGVIATLGQPGLVRLPGVIDRAAERAYAFTPFTAVFNISGQPSASVPLYWNADGLPIGSMITGRFGEDGVVLQLAAQLEEARPWIDKRPVLG